MALTIPTLESSPTFDGQTVADSTDFAALTAQASDQGVYVGCSVTPYTGSDMNVSIAAGTISIGGKLVSVSAVSSLAISAASSYDRRDIVTVNSSGTVSVTTGTPCTTAGWSRSSSALPPVKPGIPSNSVLLAEVYVASSTTAIASGNIIDKTALVLPDVLAEVSYGGGGTYTRSATALAAVDSTHLTMTFIAPPSGNVRLRADFVIGGSSASYYIGIAWLNHGLTTLFSGSNVLTFRPDLAAGAIPTNWEWLVTGLTPGTSYSIDLGWGVSSTSMTASIYSTANTSTTVSTANGAPVHLMALAA